MPRFSTEGLEWEFRTADTDNACQFCVARDSVGRDGDRAYCSPRDVCVECCIALNKTQLVRMNYLYCVCCIDVLVGIILSG